jgi:hypothetical protein
MKPEVKEFAKSTSIELFVYAALVFAYFMLVLKFLGGWLDRLFVEDRKLYAGIALGLIIAQGVGLEWLTTTLIRLIRTRRGR